MFTTNDEPVPENNQASELKSKLPKWTSQQSWLEKYKWLEFDPLKRMFCLLCQKSKKSNPLTIGRANYRTSTLVWHFETKDHQNAIEKVEMAASVQQTAMNDVSSQEKSVVTGMRTVYWLAKEYIATEKYNSLLNFSKLQHEWLTLLAGQYQISFDATLA